MKFKALQVLILLLFSQCATAQSTKNNGDDAAKLTIILNDLATLVNEAKIPDRKIKPLLFRSISRINSGMLKIEVNENIEKDIFEGAQFSFRGDGIAPTVSVSPLIVDIYKEHPTLVYSILLHEFMHSDSFFADKEEFILVKDNPNERYLYELDAYHMEAVFLTAYVLPSGKYKLTKFEDFLSHSFQKDNLSDFSFSLLGYDMDLVFFLNNVVHSKQPKEEKLRSIMEVSNKILKAELNRSPDKWENYQSIVPLHTMVQFLAQIVRDVDTYPATPEDIQKNRNFNLKESHPDFYFMLNELNNKFQKNRDLFGYYYDIRDNFRQI